MTTLCTDSAASGPTHRCHGAACERERANARAHRIADRLQALLLHTHPREALPGLATEGFYQAALSEATVGGDSFDAFPLPNVSPRFASPCGLFCVSIAIPAGRSRVSTTLSATPSGWASGKTARSRL